MWNLSFRKNCLLAFCFGYLLCIFKCYWRWNSKFVPTHSKLLDNSRTASWSIWNNSLVGVQKNRGLLLKRESYITLNVFSNLWQHLLQIFALKLIIIWSVIGKTGTFIPSCYFSKDTKCQNIGRGNVYVFVLLGHIIWKHSHILYMTT